MPRCSRRRLVPMIALIACAMSCAGASAAPLQTFDPPLPRDEQRAETAARATTMRALVDRKERHRAQAARADSEVAGVVHAATAQIGTGYAYGGSGPGG